MQILPWAQFKSFGALIGSLQGAIITAILLWMLRNVLALLWLGSPFLLGSFVKCRGKFLQGTDQMDSQITFRFVGCLNRLSHTLHRSCEMLKRGLDALEACGDASEKLLLTVWIFFWCAHGFLMKGSFRSEWAQEEPCLASDFSMLLWGRCTPC